MSGEKHGLELRVAGWQSCIGNERFAERVLQRFSLSLIVERAVASQVPEEFDLCECGREGRFDSEGPGTKSDIRKPEILH